MTATARLGAAGVMVLGLLAFTAIFAPVLAPYDPAVVVGEPLESPSWAHPLGTDDIGQDLLSQLLVGTRISLMVGVGGALLAVLLGTTIGLTAGVVGGAVDFALMRLVDVVLTLPMLPLMIVLHVWLGAGLGAEVLVIGGLMWARTARLLRAQALSVRERGAVSAARVMGAGTPHLLRWHIVPAVFPLVVPELVRAVNIAIAFETSLSFLGFGNPTAKSWGTILFYANARSAYLTDAWPWWVVPPGLAVSLTVLAFAAVGYALEEAARPMVASLRRREAPATPSSVPQQSARGGDTAVVEAQAVSIAYPAAAGLAPVVREVSLAIARSEIVAIVGESGSGKTTLASALLQLSRPPGVITGGRLLVGGRDVTHLSEPELCALRGAVVSLVPQSAMNALNPLFAVGRQLIESLQRRDDGPDTPARLRARDLLTSVGLDATRDTAYPHELSGGMRQRVVIAMAMSQRPQLVIADEPTTGLDPVTQIEILALLRTLRDRAGTAVLLISHDLGAVASVADRILVMHEGRVVEEGPAANVMLRPRHAYTRKLVNAVPPLTSSRSRMGGAGASRLLEVRQLRKTFAPHRRGAAPVEAIRDVTFEVGAGESVALVGASGAGKSTLARIITGLEAADDGTVRLEGAIVDLRRRGQRRPFGRRVHFILQDPYDALPPSLRVRQIVAEPVRIHGPAACLDVGEALASAGLDAAQFADRFAHQLSGGERQRVALARALMVRPRLIVADEPTAQLDVSRRADLIEVMREAARRHATAYLYITHDLALAQAFCDRMLVLASGRIVESGTPADLIARPMHPATVALVAAAEQRTAIRPTSAPA